MSYSNTNNNTNTNTIVPRDCAYQCGVRIYWNNQENAYFEVFSKKKHICKNRPNNKSVNNTNATTNNKPNYYNKYSKQPKPKMIL